MFNYDTYIYQQFKKIRINIFLYNLLFYLLSTLIIFLTFFITISSLIFLKQKSDKPLWYPFFGAIVSSFSTFFSSIIGFLQVQNKIKVLQYKYNKLQFEINKYELNLEPKYKDIDNKFFLFLKVENIINNQNEDEKTR